jgi:hypothetical protein
MKVRYTGNGYNLNTNDIYEVEDSSQFEYQIRNDVGRLAWYVKTNFIEVKDKVKVSANPTNTISPDLVSKIEKELKDTEQRMADLRKQLEDAKTPPTKNILLRAARKNPNWMCDAVVDCFDSLVEALDNAVRFPKGLAMYINGSGDGITLDDDYRWELTEDKDGYPALMVFDKE